MRQLMSAAQVRERLRYDGATGEFRWLKPTTQVIAVGAVAGTTDRRGRRVVTILGERYFAHRLAWLYVNGKWPENEIDHRDGNVGNNAIANLRDVTGAVNKQNRRTAGRQNKVGLLGVSRYQRRGKRGGWRNDCFRARIRLDGKARTIGYYATPEEAHAAYLSEKRRLHVGNML